MRLPPTATVLINQTYQLPSSLQTTHTNSSKKSVYIFPYPFTVHSSIPLPHWKTNNLIQDEDFHLKIDSFRSMKDDDDSSKE